MGIRRLALATVFFALAFVATAQNGTIKGVVTDASTDEPLIGATVMLEGTTIGVLTDFDGNYTLGNITPGTYNVRCSFISYETSTIENVEITSGNTQTFNFEMGESTMQIEDVQVVAKANRESESMLLLDQKEASGITESIGSRQLSSMGVSDAASATTKISGVTKTEGSGDVYIRGLGDRYLSTTMNGLPIPSDDVSKKNIDLELFSTDVISNVGINKTYDIATYGDQASGNVDVVSKTISHDISVSLSSGVNSTVLSSGKFNDFKATQNSNDITFGYYKKPYITADAVSNQSWNAVSKKLPLDYGLSIIGGNEFYIGNGDKLSLFVTASHSGDSEYREGEYRRYESNYYDREFTDAEDYISTIETNGLLNLTYDFSSKSSISYNALYVNKTEDKLYEAGRNRTGYYFERTGSSEGDNSVFIRDQNIVTTEVLVNQLIGKHQLSEKNNVKWAVAYNIVNADEPSRIRNVVSIPGEFVNYVRVGGFDQRKSSQNINDSELNGYLKDEFSFVDEEDKIFKINTGLNFRYKERKFDSKFVGVEVDHGITGTDIDNMDEVLLNQSYYNNESLEINEQKLNLYNAELLVYAGYADIAWRKSRFSGNVGFRYEHDYLFVEWDVTNSPSGDVEYTYDNILPAFNIKYDLTDKSALRLAASKTITLPEFKELARFEYVSPEGDVSRGDEDVKMSEVYNIDLKWELFPGNAELISLGAFYKMINDPINQTMVKGSSQAFYYANTGEKANVYGIELEIKKNLLATSEKHKLNLSFNATKMWFEQDLLEYHQYNNKTKVGLEGASEFITNASLSYATKNDNPFTATVSGNYSSDKIYALGAAEDLVYSDVYYNNEIIEKGFVTLDLVLNKDISERVSIKLSAKNLLNPPVKRVQRIDPSGDDESFDAVVRSYKRGLDISLGISMNF